jgi:hypothetical protein
MVEPRCPKIVAFLPSLINVKFYHGVDIVGGDVPINFVSDPRPFASNPGVPNLSKP